MTQTIISLADRLQRIRECDDDLDRIARWPAGRLFAGEWMQAVKLRRESLTKHLDPDSRESVRRVTPVLHDSARNARLLAESDAAFGRTKEHRVAILEDGRPVR